MTNTEKVAELNRRIEGHRNELVKWSLELETCPNDEYPHLLILIELTADLIQHTQSRLRKIAES